MNELFSTGACSVENKYLFTRPKIAASLADCPLALRMEIGGKLFQNVIYIQIIWCVNFLRPFYTWPSWWLQKSHNGIKALMGVSCWSSDEGIRFCLVITVETAHLLNENESKNQTKKKRKKREKMRNHTEYYSGQIKTTPLEKSRQHKFDLSGWKLSVFFFRPVRRTKVTPTANVSVSLFGRNDKLVENEFPSGCFSFYFGQHQTE